MDRNEQKHVNEHIQRSKDDKWIQDFPMLDCGIVVNEADATTNFKSCF